MIKISPLYIKTVIIGEITVVAIIPTGLNVPKSFNPIGAVIICAPVEDANEDEINEGKIFEYIL